MPITIKLGDAADKTVTLEMNVRKSLNGDLMIFDHNDIDIVISPTQNKIVVFPKEVMSDYVYGAQNRLFAFLQKKGVVLPESVQAGAVCGAIEASLQEPVNIEISAPKIALVNISNFIDDERPYFDSTEAIVSATDDNLTDPENEVSTELGDVPHATKQGSIRSGGVRDPYSLNYMYTL